MRYTIYWGTRAIGTLITWVYTHQQPNVYGFSIQIKEGLHQITEGVYTALSDWLEKVDQVISFFFGWKDLPFEIKINE